jgi:hypothetical protein
VTTPSQQTDHQQAALDLLPAQFEFSTRLRAIIGDFVGPANPVTWGAQELEDVLFALLEQRWLSTAGGVQLDGLGEILGEPRLTDIDEDYRDALYLRVIINVSEGEPERLIEVVERLTAPTAVHLMIKPPAAVLITAIDMTKTLLLSRVQQAALGGVRVWLSGGTGAAPFIYGRGADAGGTQHGTPHPHGGLGYGVPGAPGTGGEYVALYEIGS